MQRRNADCASIVNLSAFDKIIVLNRVDPLISTLICVLAKNFNSSRINFIPLPCAQFTFIT